MLENTQVLFSIFSIRYCNMEVEYLIETLGYLVIWLFSGLHYISTKLLVIVSVRLSHGGFWLIYIRDVNQPINNGRSFTAAYCIFFIFISKM